MRESLTGGFLESSFHRLQKKMAVCLSLNIVTKPGFVVANIGKWSYCENKVYISSRGRR